MVLDFLLSQFINNNVYLGYHKKYIVNSAFSFVSGIRYNNILINLIYSIYNFKNVFTFLNHFWNNMGTLWLVFFFQIPFFWDPILLKELKFRVTLWKQKWKSGLLSNYKHLLLCKVLDFEKISYPNSVFFFGTVRHLDSFREPQLVNSVSIVVADTMIGQRNNCYCIPGNEKSITSYYLYLKILQNFILRIFILKKLYFFKKICNKT